MPGVLRLSSRLACWRSLYCRFPATTHQPPNSLTTGVSARPLLHRHRLQCAAGRTFSSGTTTTIGSAGLDGRNLLNQDQDDDGDDENEDGAAPKLTKLERLQQALDRTEAAGLVVPVFKRALLYGSQPALKDADAEYTYAQLYGGAKRLSFQLSNLCGSGSCSRVALLTAQTALFTVAQWAAWFSGQVIVPLSPKQPPPQLAYFLRDSGASVLVCDAANEPTARELSAQLALPLLVIHPSDTIPAAADLPAAETEIALAPDHLEATQNAAFYTKHAAMVLYTSGSTGAPKGTVLTHRMLAAQTRSLRAAWQCSGADRVLHVLPLNHVHGAVNALQLPLSLGAKVLTHNGRFDAAAVWAALLNVRAPQRDRISVFMAVPTIYALLLDEYDRAFGGNPRMRDYVRQQCEKSVRLMVSGSAPLPTSVFRRWHEVTGHRLLERYGMTECGMALSQPLREDRVRRRQEGRVGVPLPGVEVRLVRATDGKVVAEARGEADRGWWAEHALPEYEHGAGAGAEAADAPQEPAIGELCVRGDGVFSEYLNRAQETRATFMEDGWFRTGDEARRHADGTFQILGRQSVDIIKTGGYKVSALEVETAMLDHPHVRDVCVVGVPDVTWGQRVAAVVVVDAPTAGDVEPETATPTSTSDAAIVAAASSDQQQDVRQFCREQLASYQVPSEFRWVERLPRNAMGKVNKREVLASVFGVVQPPKQTTDAEGTS